MKRWLKLISTLMVVLVAVVGCSSPNPSGTASSSEGLSGDDLSEKLDITWMATSYEGGGWPDDHPMVRALNEKFNINLKFQWVPAANYQEKLNVLAASNDFPDVFSVDAQEFNKWKDEGLFLDIQPVLGNYPHLQTIPKDALSIMNPQGKLLGLPYYITQARDSLSVRQDWLKKLNLQKPDTLDKFFDVAKAFAEQDPDGNGSPDTSGFTFYLEPGTHNFRGIEYIQAAFGLANQWKEQDGKLVPYQTQVEEWKQLLTFLNKAYKEGVLDKDFAVNTLTAPTEKLEAGKVGFAYVNPNQYQKSVVNLRKSFPEGSIVPIEPPTGPTGLSGTATFDMLRKVVVNDNIDPIKHQRILSILDYFLSEEGADFIKHGIEGVHYKKDADGKYVKLEAADKDRQNLINNWIFRPFDPGIQMYKWDDGTAHQAIRDMFANNAKHAWINPAAGLESATYTRLGTNLNAKFMDTATHIIIGREPVDAIEAASADWLASGGNQIVEDINAAYNK